ncbi:MAG TPA: EAL domain-containing protein [Candidatus Polarisedimenticolia bacterium]|nr:EAL domain-containing protein [Candidatus Polarisedimenticolia bacterium]
MPPAAPPDGRRRPRIPKMALYGAIGIGFGLSLTGVGWVVDYWSLYGVLPKRLDFAMIQGLHRVTPLHYFSDFFALLLGIVGAAAGRLQDRVLYYSRHLQDLVTERTEDLRRSQERYELAAHGANDGLWDWDLQRDHVYYSPRWKQALGHADSEVADDPKAWFDRVHPDDRGGLDARIRTHLAGGSDHLVAEYRLRHADGSMRWMLSRGVAVRDPATGRPARMAGSQTDIDEQKQMEEQLRRLALHDPLTGLANRTLFVDRLSRAFARARRRRRTESLALIFVDIDRFKNINDSLGHAIGDSVLTVIAARVRACLERTFPLSEVEEAEETRPGERRLSSWTLARMGGDEFIVLLEEIRSLREATQAAQALEAEFKQSVQVEGRDLFVTLSTGIALGPGAYERPDDLLRDADTAMYRAKAAGRGRFEIFDGEMLARAQEQLRLETDLHQAMARGEFHVVFQPIVELESGRLRGFEALLRWKHPERGLIPPARFIPLAEEIGLILPLGRMMMREACRTLSRWHRIDPAWRDLTLATNLSLRQIYNPGLEEDVEAILQETGVEPASLYFEITENTLIEHPKQVIKVLTRLKRRGFGVAIDDFGTGYSSLAMLQDLPVDILKIDQVFVSRMDEKKGRQIVATIVGLGRALGHEVIAEGIETDDQASELRRLRCALGQGFLFAEPLEAAETESRVLAPAALESRPRRRAA